MSKGKLLAVCVVWLMIAAGLAAAYRLFIYPYYHGNVMANTSSDSKYKHSLNVALDSFSGYAVLRSPYMKDELTKRGIRLNLSDDGADYGARIESLRSGQTQMAVFTIDALLKVSADIGDMPGTIVAIIDETRGADAVVAYKDAVPNIDALNRVDMRFVLTPDSPSETLARVVRTHFQLDNLPKGDAAFVKANDAEAVYKVYRKANQNQPQAFVLWEPYVTKVLENPNTHIVADSSKFRGYIVDVLVVNRDYLLKNQDVVQEILGCYFRAAYHYRDSMVDLVLADAKQTGTALNRKQAENLVKGIWWKNTQENFAHFGLQQGKSTQLLEDMIGNITTVLQSTGGMASDPTNGRPTDLYYDKLLTKLQTNNFHPGLASEKVRDDRISLPKLTEEQWKSLAPVGTLSVPKLEFGRGNDSLTPSSEVTLDDLVKTLSSFPQAYVIVQGNASTKGNAEANQRLAQDRAAAAERYLVGAGVDANRIHAVAGKPSGSTTVSFVLGQPPY